MKKETVPSQRSDFVSGKGQRVAPDVRVVVAVVVQSKAEPPFRRRECIKAIIGRGDDVAVIFLFLWCVQLSHFRSNQYGVL